MGPPLAAAIAALAAALGLLIARQVAAPRNAVVRARLTWLLCVPMLFSGIGILFVALALLPTVTLAGLLLLGWGATHLAIVAVTLTRLARASDEAGTRRGSPLGGPLGDHLTASLILLVIGAPVALAGLLIWAAQQG